MISMLAIKPLNGTCKCFLYFQYSNLHYTYMMCSFSYNCQTKLHKFLVDRLPHKLHYLSHNRCGGHSNLNNSSTSRSVIIANCTAKIIVYYYKTGCFITLILPHAELSASSAFMAICKFIHTVMLRDSEPLSRWMYVVFMVKKKFVNVNSQCYWHE